MHGVHTGLNGAAAATTATPLVQDVRDNPPPFWAMESQLREYLHLQPAPKVWR